MTLKTPDNEGACLAQGHAAYWADAARRYQIDAGRGPAWAATDRELALDAQSISSARYAEARRLLGIE